MKSFLKMWQVPLGLSLIVLAIAAMGTWGRDSFQYLGPQLSGKGFANHYRWISGHFTHLGWSHMTLNVIGMLSVWWLYGRYLTRELWIIFILICAFGISLGLYFLSPHVDYYVGLSGVLHGMLSAGVTLALLENFKSKNRLKETASISWEELFVLLGLWGKIAYEQIAGSLPITTKIAGNTVIVETHLYGAIIGCVFTIILQIASSLLKALLALKK